MLFYMYYGTLWYLTSIFPGFAFIFTTFDVLQQDEARFQRKLVLLHTATCVHFKLLDCWEVLFAERAATSWHLVRYFTFLQSLRYLKSLC